MPNVKKNFDSYKMWYYSNYSYECLIYCYNAGEYVGRITFYKDEATIPQNKNYTSGPSLNFPVSKFGDIMGILRHEKPLYLSLSLTNFSGIIGTSDFEPTGEEE